MKEDDTMSLQDLTIKLEVILFHAINRLGNNAKVNFRTVSRQGIFPGSTILLLREREINVRGDNSRERGSHIGNAPTVETGGGNFPRFLFSPTSRISTIIHFDSQCNQDPVQLNTTPHPESAESISFGC